MKSSGDKDKNRGVSLQMNNLHQRLLHALNLGTRYFDEKTNQWKWQSANIEVQKQVIRSIDVFLDFVSGDARAAHHSIVKDSVADILGALLWILRCKNRPLLCMAANVAVKLVSVLPHSIFESYILDLVYALSSLLSSPFVEVAIPCSTSLNLVISNLNASSAKAVWEMSSLLGSILLWWPPTRFPVWNDVQLINTLSDMYARTDISTKLVILKLYTSLALCGSVAKKLIENGEVFLQMVVQSMGKSYPDAVRIEGFRLSQCLLRSQENCLKVMDTCGEALVDAIICGMEETGMHSRKFVNKNSSILVEACRLALVTRWAGDHHISFWKQRIDKVLLNLLIENIHDLSEEHVSSLDKQISIAKEGLKTNHQLCVRGYVWDILGWLTIHSGENFNPCIHGSGLYINLIIICACLTFEDVIKKWCRIYQKDADDSFQSEPASRAVLMMIYSPCNYISSQARLIFSKTYSSDHFTSLAHTLEYASSLESYGSFDKLQLIINLIGLISFLSLPHHHTLEGKYIRTVAFIVKRCLGNDIDVSRLSLAPHLHTTLYEKSCCWMDAEDWEGSNILLFYGLWGLAEMVHQSAPLQNNSRISIVDIEYFEAQLVRKLLEICSNASFTHGLRWYAAYILSHFGFYGFPNELGKRVGRCLNEKEYADIQLFLANGNTLSVHGVILAVRCSSLLPPEVSLVKEKRIDGQSIREVRLSSHVDYEALVKLLEYVYVGYFHADEEIVKKLKILAKRCDLQPLLQMLHRQSPKWGTSFPSFDLTPSLVSAGSCFWDVILESKQEKLEGWTCCTCSHSVPHLHVHKVILQSGCDYLQGLFRSGMKESNSPIIKVPTSWEAANKLVHWFYSSELPNPPSGCLWDNMDDEQKLCSLQSYVELYWLSEFWILEDVQEACWNVIVSYLDNSKQLSLKMLKMAGDLSLWKLADVAAIHLAPSYSQLRDSCELEDLDDALVHLICSASTQLSQNG
ncbi:BTB/POZ domain-containing protein At1g04390 isoform X2 [Neltuma alba]|uniref:BTB/POZ domain-containing protein At1g04390 isoform X2 n=1 Tax=Neltuma alba TaxID=207710 RepID=UPI0010A3E4A5|nr:BTB/POZ domain-containing protein At1g04390 isoform X2 [Prosopis alba]